MIWVKTFLHLDPNSTVGQQETDDEMQRPHTSSDRVQTASPTFNRKRHSNTSISLKITPQFKLLTDQQMRVSHKSQSSALAMGCLLAAEPPADTSTGKSRSRSKRPQPRAEMLGKTPTKRLWRKSSDVPRPPRRPHRQEVQEMLPAAGAQSQPRLGKGGRHGHRLGACGNWKPHCKPPSQALGRHFANEPSLLTG